MPRFSPTVIDHFTNPRGCGRLPNPDVSAFIGNPVCGDQILLTASIHNDAVSEIGFEAFGCSASLAIASILTERLAGMPITEIADLDVTHVVQWSGGLAPDQQHAAALGADVAHRLAANFSHGITEDERTCSGG